jgi:hypothetical protein
MIEETATKPLRELVRAFSRGKILLPQFQRPFPAPPMALRRTQRTTASEKLLARVTSFL